MYPFDASGRIMLGTATRSKSKNQESGEKTEILGWMAQSSEALVNGVEGYNVAKI